MSPVMQLGAASAHSPAAQPSGAGDLDAGSPCAVRAQILATEHWSLLATRSTTQSEMLSRITTLLMLISASLISLGLIGQLTRFDRRFITFALVLLGMDLVMGTLTQLRVRNANIEDLAHVIGMNRLRAAYVELDPAIERYLVTSAHDDTAGVWQTYNHLVGPNPSQRYASTGAFITFLNSGLAGVIAALVAGALSHPGPLAGMIGAAGGLGFYLISTTLITRRYLRVSGRFTPRFPHPRDAGPRTDGHPVIRTRHGECRDDRRR